MKPRAQIIEIIEVMRRYRITLDDLIQIGGEDFSSSSLKRIEKARRVEKCWSLMARLSVNFADLEDAPPPQHPTNDHEGGVARVTFRKPLKTQGFLEL
jgi:hypothetical protein